jgi:hypothetical protein
MIQRFTVSHSPRADIAADIRHGEKEGRGTAPEEGKEISYTAG